MKQIVILLRAFLILLLGLSFTSELNAENLTLRFGHFPTITHAQGLIAHHRSRLGDGWFEPRLGNDIKIEWYTYNAGPSAMEAILTGSLDLAYVGPSPAINAFVRSQGKEIRVLAAAVYGGSALVVRQDSGIFVNEDFRGKKIATPQFGNTQDISARSWLIAQGIQVTQSGGDAKVIPTENADQPMLFQRKELDAAWTVEPWISRLEAVGGRVYLLENEVLTTVLVTSAKLLSEQPAVVEKIILANQELTAWLEEHPEKAKEELSKEIEIETKRPLPPALLNNAWPRMKFSAQVSLSQFDSYLISAKKLGFLKNVNDISGLAYGTTNP